MLVDATALTQLLSQHLAGLEPAARFVTEQAAAQASEEMARTANSLSVETAAMRAVGLYTLNPVDPQLESAWFQPLNL